MQKVYAHRGASAYAPENTLEAFALAAKQGAHGVELDVHLTKDGEIVVTHDEDIQRVSDGSGKVADMTLAELKRYNFNNHQAEYPRCEIPTLREVYELLGPAGLEVNVELKNSITRYEGMEQKCIDLAAQMGMTDKVLYSSFNHFSLLVVHDIDSGIPCGILYSGVLVHPWKYAKEVGATAIHPQLDQLLVPGLVKETHAEGIRINPWTVNNEMELRFAFGAGADCVITNHPDRALKVLQSLQR